MAGFLFSYRFFICNHYLYQTNNSKAISKFYLHLNLQREIKMRIFYFLCLFSHFGNTQEEVLEVMDVIIKLYKLIEVISSATKFFANIEAECDSHYFHYEVRAFLCQRSLNYCCLSSTLNEAFLFKAHSNKRSA